jgi:membrane glycosyltransferase
MLFHSTFVAQTLLGRSVSWNAQVRTDRGVTLGEAFQRQKWHLAFGIAWGVSMWWLAPQFFWWLTPVLLGLICSVPLTSWTSRSSAGVAARRHGLLLTPEETAPPPELQALSDALNAPAETPGAPAPAAPPTPEPVVIIGTTPESKEKENVAEAWIPDHPVAVVGSRRGVGGSL